MMNKNKKNLFDLVIKKMGVYNTNIAHKIANYEYRLCSY